MKDRVQEWLKQAAYDFETAEFMLKSGRPVYAAFMLHLSVEKTLKARYQDAHDKLPPKVHNLVYLVERINDEAPEHIVQQLARLNHAHIATRYPDELEQAQKEYSRAAVTKLLHEAKEVRQWLIRNL